MAKQFPIGRRAALAGGIMAATPALAQQNRPAQQPARSDAQQGQVIIGRDGWLFAAWEDIRRVDLRRTREVARYINGAVAIMAEAGFRVALCVTPTKARVYEEFLPDDFRPNADATARYDAVLEEFARGPALLVDHATQSAQLRRSQRDALFFKADIHWTPVTGAAAAAELARVVRERGNLPAATRHGTQLGDMLTMRYERNDLAEMLGPEQQRRFPFENFRVRRIQGAPQGVGLIEEDGADVIIVGNSFMQTGCGFPPMFSNQLNRPVALAVQVGRFGPYTTLLNYLRSDLFRQNRPNLIVWHFLEGNMEVMPDNPGFWGSAAMPARQFTDELRRLARRA
ncbi:MAG: hypothetical protein NTW56_02740 [Alphaproteobacteria bacterium]|nr:hypothetical protein [Alphaproteobacteria bacterium]